MGIEFGGSGASSAAVIILTDVNASLASNLPTGPLVKAGDLHRISDPGNFESSASVIPSGQWFETGDYIKRNVANDKWTLIEGNDDIISEAFGAGWTGDILNGASRADLKTKIDTMDTARALNTTHRGRTDDPHSVTKTQVSLGNVADLKVKLDATVAPGVTDDSNAGYAVLSRWADVTAGKEYVCLDNTNGAADWIETTGGGAGGFYTDTDDYVISPAATITVDRANGEVHNILLNRASTDVNVLSNIPNGATITLNATSDGTAGRLIVFSAAGVEYVGGVEPIKTSAANSKDIFEIKKTSSAPKFLIKHLANVS